MYIQISFCPIFLPESPKFWLFFVQNFLSEILMFLRYTTIYNFLLSRQIYLPQLDILANFLPSEKMSVFVDRHLVKNVTLWAIGNKQSFYN